ncbi:DnaD domain protein [Brevibacillus aydinogluensis]|uniref:DnaB-2 domain-containing protein n=1 Tax=Brevibacillus aydinogluensis TaxID=927786 RepID=A0AA48M7E3_9BACL|nr:DnaD domain protein [Brevibacillus aydinogluensis]CAJ1000993.1 DnaB-2 domain-containing protein [Brevibacillus aydinogluensis]
MNYIQEINAFYDWLETNPIPDSAIVLWHALMHINNKAGWVPEFAVAISTLSVKTGLKKDAVNRARHRLQQAGRIEFRSRSGQQSAVYRIIPFASEKTTQSASQTASQTYEIDHCVGLSDTNRITNREQTATQSASQTASIIKLNETKQNETKESAAVTGDDPFTFYQNNFGVMSPFIVQDMTQWCEEMGDQLVVEAMKRALVQNQTRWSYVTSILKDWLNKGYKTLEAVEAEKVAIKRRREERTARRVTPLEDKLPASVQWQQRQGDRIETGTPMGVKDDPELSGLLSKLRAKQQTAGG